MPVRPPRRAAALALVALLGLTAVLAGCSSGGSGTTDALVVYNAQNSRLMKVLADAFTTQTGIPVRLRNGGDSELGNQLVQEGDRSPADVFTTENATAMAQVARAGRFAPLAPATVAGVPAQYVPADRAWVAVAGRATTLLYDPQELTASALPASLLELTEPAWKGRFAYAPTGADFQAIAAAVYALEGDAVGDRFVQGLRTNGVPYDNNIAILKAVDAGEIPAGITYHYYWFQDHAGNGQDSDRSQLHYFRAEDPGAFFSVGGAGVLAASRRAEQAERFVAFLAGTKGQAVLAGSKDFQYTVRPDVPSNPVLTPLDQLRPPRVPLADLDGAKVLEAFRKVGIL